jgi:hypothetical protein
MNTIPTVVNGATVFHIICLAKRGLTNPREPSRMVPEDNAEMTRIAHPGPQVVVLSVIAGTYSIYPLPQFQLLVKKSGDFAAELNRHFIL